MLSERFDVFVMLPVTIVVGILAGLMIAGVPTPTDTARGIILSFFGIYIGLVMFNVIMQTLQSGAADILNTLSGTSEKSDEAGEPGEIIVPLVRDEYIFGVVKLFNPIPNDQRKRPYEEKRLSRVIAGWIKTLRDRKGSKAE